MTRQDIIKLFPDATDEQITNLLNKSNGEIQREKDNAKKYKEKADTADDLKKQLDDLQSQNLSDAEKLTKELEKANNKIADLEKADAIRSQRALAMEKFNVTGEQAGKIVKDDGTFDYEVLGQIIKDKETQAVADYEKKALEDTGSPSGGTGGDDKNEENPADVSNAKNLSFGNVGKDAQAARDYYK